MSRRVRFADTDPAGIVYYPRYFIMTNDLIEEWFTDGLDLPFHKILEDGKRAVPFLNVDGKFSAPSRLGDMLDFTLAVSRLGTKSFSLAIAAHCAGEARLTSQQTIAWVHRDGGAMQAETIPPEVRAVMEGFLENP